MKDKKEAKSSSTKSNKKSDAGRFLIALSVIVILTSMSYTAFITVVGVGGRTNLYLAAPSMLAVLVTILVALYQAAKNFK